MAPLYYFIINPKSGSNIDITCIRHLSNYLRSRDCEVRLELTCSLAHAGELAQKAVVAGAVAIIVAGGDGTVRVVADALVGTDLPILIIPYGTENLLACELGLDHSLATIQRVLKVGRLRNLDLGQANGRCFMAVAGIGFDAEVVIRVHSQRSGHISHASYIWPICRTFWEYSFPQLRVEADGHLLCDEPALVFVSNISRYAVGLGISLDADFSDGLLDLCIFRCDNQLRLLSHALITALRISHKSESVIRKKCRKISISSPDPGVLVQLDGDPGPSLPLNIEVLPAAAKVLTPPPLGSAQYHRPMRFYHLRRWLLG